MNKKYLSVVLFGALLLGTAGTFTSCKDYDDDIENLQGQIDKLSGSVDDLKKMIEAGCVVTSVDEVTGVGVKISFSNGKTFTLKNGEKGDKGDTGATGAAGKDADVWTIGQDGYWYKNKEKTDYVAVPTAVPGTDGKTYFYKPNTETECFDLWEIVDGKEQKVKETDISYVAKSGLSVVHNGNTLIINGAVDGEGNPAGPVTLKLGEKLASIAFVPEFLDQYSKYPITKFYHIEKYLSEDKYFTTGTLATEKWDFKPQDDYDKSNEVKMTYRVNPNGAYLQDVVLSFINRKITTTKTVDGDMSNLMNRVAGTEVISEETITTNATLNASQRKEANASTNPATFDLVALQAAVGAVAPVTSDYTAVRSEEIKPYLVDTKQTTAAAGVVEYFNRKKAIVGDNEDDNFVKKFVPIVTDVTAPNAIPAHLKFAYKDEAGNPGKIDLKDKVALYGKKADGTALGYLKDLGFTGIRYEFSLPKEYKAADQNNTNQQWFVDLDNDGVLSVNAANLNNNLTPAIGRRPVVRVDAFMKNNAGEEKLVASSYIRLEIVEFLLEGENNIVLNNEQFYEYHNLGTAYTSVANMSWQRINNEIYGVEHLTANTFWNYYGGTATPRTYEVKVITYDKATGNKKSLLNDNAVPANTAYVNNTSIPGIQLQINLNASDVTTSYIKVGVNNLVKTENTHKDMGNGAKYEVTITIEPNDPAQHRKFILTQVFDVVDDCQFYKFNPLYHFTSWGAATGNFIKVKGKVSGGTWKIISELPEHFEMVDIDPSAAENWQNIFGYYKTTASPVKNVAATTNNLKFKWNATNGQNALPAGEINESSTDMTLRLNHAMKDAEEIKQMDYWFTLVNGEECKTSYNVVFVNPFKSGGIQGVSLNGNGIGAQTVETRTQISVIDNENDEIFKWYDVDAEHATAGLYRTDKCKNTYKVARPTVAYAWVTDAAYYALKNQMTANSTLDCNATTGLITWDNDGATLQNVHNLKVKATVTFADLSIVEVIIPVTIKTAE